jgi:excisionase family DNA binding protein
MKSSGRDTLRRNLMSPADQEAFLRTYGEAMRPMLEATLDAKVEELAARYEKAWHAFGEYLRSDEAGVLVSRDEAAEMLGVSLSSIQRLEKRGELPEPQRFGARTVRHRLEDIRAFAKRTGRAIQAPTTPKS